MVTKYQRHCLTWAGGCGSVECAGAKHVVLSRGSVPCDILFIGEAPGPSEDSLGVPFIGPAGKLLDLIVARSVTPDTRVCFTNLVACVPRDDDGNKAMEPSEEQVESCAPRLREFVALCRPKLIVTVGAKANAWTDPKHSGSIRFHDTVPRVSVTHPAAILRANATMKGMMVQRQVAILSTAIQELVVREGE